MEKIILENMENKKNEIIGNTIEWMKEYDSFFGGSYATYKHVTDFNPKTDDMAMGSQCGYAMGYIQAVKDLKLLYNN